MFQTSSIATHPAARRASLFALRTEDARRARSSPSCQVTCGPASGAEITGFDICHIPLRRTGSGGGLDSGEHRVFDVLLHEAGLAHELEDLLLLVHPLVLEVDGLDVPVV